MKSQDEQRLKQLNHIRRSPDNKQKSWAKIQAGIQKESGLMRWKRRLLHPGIAGPAVALLLLLLIVPQTDLFSNGDDTAAPLREESTERSPGPGDGEQENDEQTMMEEFADDSEEGSGDEEALAETDSEYDEETRAVLEMFRDYENDIPEEEFDTFFDLYEEFHWPTALEINEQLSVELVVWLRDMAESEKSERLAPFIDGLYGVNDELYEKLDEMTASWLTADPAAFLTGKVAHEDQANYEIAVDLLLSYAAGEENDSDLSVFTSGMLEAVDEDDFELRQSYNELVEHIQHERHDGTDTEADVTEQAAQLLEAFEEMDTADMAAQVHPEEGVTFSLFQNIEDDAPVFSADQVSDFAADDDIYWWGRDDADQDFEMTPQEYIEEQLLQYNGNRDLTYGEATFNESQAPGGGRIHTHFERWNESVYAEFYDEGDGEIPDYQGLRLVYEQYEGDWYLVAVVRDVHTP